MIRELKLQLYIKAIHYTGQIIFHQNYTLNHLGPTHQKINHFRSRHTHTHTHFRETYIESVLYDAAYSPRQHIVFHTHDICPMSSPPPYMCRVRARTLSRIAHLVRNKFGKQINDSIIICVLGHNAIFAFDCDCVVKFAGGGPAR